MDTNALRELVDAVDREISRLADSPEADSAERSRAGSLKVAWAKLVGSLALGPAPELRSCPHCGASGMRAATLCGYCWGALVPLPPLAPRARP